MPRAKIAEGAKVRALRPHHGHERQIPLARLRDLPARKHPHAGGIEQQARHHRGVKRWGTTGFLLIERIETAHIQLGHRIQQDEDQIALRQLGLRAMGLLSIALGLPRPIRFPGGLAHH